MSAKTLIGQAVVVTLPLINAEEVHARVDSGATTSAIWASLVREEKDGLHVIFFDKSSDHYTGEEVVFSQYEEVMVTSSNGHAEKRFKVKLSVRLVGRRISTWFTLSDRSTQIYPMLIGRNLLRGKFIVDVTLGQEYRLSRDKILYKVLHDTHDIKKEQQ